MTNNKLPEIGARYKSKRMCRDVIVNRIFKPLIETYVEFTPIDSGFSYNFTIDYFLNEFEPLPEDNSNQSEVEKTEESLPKSIWKDVSELSLMSQEYVLAKGKKCGGRRGDAVIAKHFDGKFYDLGNNSCYWRPDAFEKYCTLSDYLDQQEQNAKRLDKLELLIKEL